MIPLFPNEKKEKILYFPYEVALTILTVSMCELNKLNESRGNIDQVKTVSYTTINRQV